jgi:alkylation response protein AidB-like acyl-CoA dehydrogenase
MDLGLDEQQEMLKTFARDFLEKECPESVVRAMEEDEKGYSPELWSKMAEQGWMGLTIPEAYGGSGLTLCEQVVLLEEFGRALVPGPFISTTVLGATPIMEAGSEAQKKEYLPKIASGELIMTMALTEPSAKWSSDGVTLSAKKEGSDYVLNGTKLFVPDAHVSDAMIVVARTSGKGDSGISLFIVDSKSSGIKFEVLKTIAADKQCEVTFDNVKVPAANLLGKEGKGWAIVAATEKARAVRPADWVVPGDPAQARRRRHRCRWLALHHLQGSLVARRG